MNPTQLKVFDSIHENIQTRKRKNIPLLVGINGVDTSGKTTFTKQLAEYLVDKGYPVQILHLDDFHNPQEIRYKEADPIYTYINNAFDLHRIEDELLKPMKQVGHLNKELMLLDLEKDEFCIKKEYNITQDTIVLFEGVLLYREPLDSYFDFRIYLDISFDEVIKRATKRDGYLFGDGIIEKYQQKYIPIQKIYMEKYKPKENSDLVICNEDFKNPKIK